MSAKSSLRVGLMSRLDYGGTDYRVGLWRLGAEVFIKEKVAFVILLGGLVDGVALEKRLVLALKASKKEDRDSVRSEFLRGVVNFLKENIPVIKGTKIYIMTSPAYDKNIGEQIGEMLAEVRSDILLYRKGGDRFELKQMMKIMGAYTPKKGVWMRGDYYDTPILRMLKDEKRRTTRGIGDIVAAGGNGVALFHPGDSSDIRRPYFTVPALCKIGEIRTGENQVGVAVVDWTTPNVKEATYKVFSFKDLLSDEWSFTEQPAGISKAQKAIVDALQKRGPLTIGLIDDFTGYDRKEIAREFGIKNAIITINERVSLDRLFDAFAVSRVYIPAVFVVNKIDLKLMENEYLEISAEKNIGIDKLITEIWNKLKFVSVHIAEGAIVMKEEETLSDVAAKIGSDFSAKVKSAKIWGPGAKFPGQEVSLFTKVQEGMTVKF